MTYRAWERSHRTTTVSPGKLDLLVVTLIDGRRAHIDPIDHYDAALARADGFARQHPCQIKVLPMTGVEARNFLAVERPDRPQPMDAALRQQFADILTGIARNSADPDARRDAFDMLTEMGVQS